jgi:hypothetical protein
MFLGEANFFPNQLGGGGRDDQITNPCKRPVVVFINAPAKTFAALSAATANRPDIPSCSLDRGPPGADFGASTRRIFFPLVISNQASHCDEH